INLFRHIIGVDTARSRTAVPEHVLEGENIIYCENVSLWGKGQHSLVGHRATREGAGPVRRFVLLDDDVTNERRSADQQAIWLTVKHSALEGESCRYPIQAVPHRQGFGYGRHAHNTSVIP